MTNISTFPGDTQGRNILKSRTITHGTSSSGEVDTYTLNPGENLIILNNHQGSAGSSRTYAANFTAGIPTALGTVLHLEINSSRTNNSGSQILHRTAIQFGGTAYLDTGNIAVYATGNAQDAYQRKLQRTIVLTVSGWVDFSLGSRVGGDTLATDIIFKTNDNVGQAATGSDSADVERMRIAANGDVTFANSLYIADYIYHSGDTNSYFGWQANDTFVLRTNGSEALSVGSDLRMTCRGLIDIPSYIRHIGDTHTYFGFSGNDNIAFYSGGTHAADIAGNGTFRFYHSMYMADYIYHYSDNNTYFGYSSNDTFVVATNGAVRFTVNSSGNLYTGYRLGIGTSSPNVQLHVHGSTNYTYSAGYYYGQSGQSSLSTRTRYVAILTNNDILTTGLFLASSDRRIKKDIVDVNDSEALDVLRLLKPKKYAYKDTLTLGTEPVWGFIAQEVGEVLSNSTSLVDGEIPNIYERAEVSESNVLTFTNFNTSELESNAMTITIMSIDNSEHKVTIVDVIDDHTIRVDANLDEWTGSIDETGKAITEITTTTLTVEEYETLENKDGCVANISGYRNGNVVVSVNEYNSLENQSDYTEDIENYTKTTTTYPGNNIFVFGQNVSDFATLNKSAIWTISTAALQEVDRQLQDTKAQLASVLTRLDVLESA
jgi:hypothetical protein